MSSEAPEIAVDERLLPPQLRRMIAAIGLPATVVLLQARGGTRLKLPTGRLRSRRSQVLSGLIGPEAAQAFQAEFCRPGRASMDLPKADKILMQVRNAAIHREAEADSLAELALRYRLTIRQVQNILATKDWPAWRKPRPQLELFETAGS